MKISRLNWGEIKGERPLWAPSAGQLYAIWPSPVDHDLCFESAGFADFGDSDSAWDDDFAQLVQWLVDALGEAGTAMLREGEYPVAGGRARHSIRDALIAAATDDNFSPCMVHFGEPPTSSVRTSDGHAILWTWMAEGEIGPVLDVVAKGREVNQMTMNWEKLA